MATELIAAEPIATEGLMKAADAALFCHKNRYLTDPEQAIMQGAIADQTYEQIAEQSGYSVSYLKRDVGPKLWRLLSEALGEEVSKTNFRGALQRYQAQAVQLQASSPLVELTPQGAAIAPLATAETIADHPPPAIANLPSQMMRQMALIPEGYVQRPPMELLCLETLRSPGSLIRVKAPTLIGKTSLMNWVMAELSTQGFQVVSLSLKLAERNVHFTELDKFLRWFCMHLSRELQVLNQIDEFWDTETLGAKMSCSTYFEDYVLTQVHKPIVLCIDDIDLLFPYPAIYEDFFGLLRSWHEKAKTRQIWKNLRIALVYSTDVYIPLNINHSPFNVGVLVEPPEFNAAQVQEFAQKLGLTTVESLIEPLMQLLGGHPYLLEQAFSYLKTHPEVALDDVLSAASTDAGIYSNHLRRLWFTLQEYPDLAIAFHHVVSATEPIQVPPLLAYQLQSLGLVEFIGNAVATRFQLYRRYFAEHFQAAGFTPPRP